MFAIVNPSDDVITRSSHEAALSVAPRLSVSVSPSRASDSLEAGKL